MAQERKSRRHHSHKSYAEEDKEYIPYQEVRYHEEEIEKKQSIFQHKNWSVKQRARLLIFLRHYHSLPSWTSERKSINLYKHMSNFLKTKTPQQCKNIHSFFKRRYLTLQELIIAVEEDITEQESYQKLINKYQKQILKFEEQNQLIADVIEQKKYFQPNKRIKYRQKEEKKLKIPQNNKDSQSDLKVNAQQLFFQQKDNRFQYQGQQSEEFLRRRKELIQKCNQHFERWIKASQLLSMREKSEH